jgi:hypothetical protein
MAFITTQGSNAPPRQHSRGSQTRGCDPKLDREGHLLVSELAK